MTELGQSDADRAAYAARFVAEAAEASGLRPKTAATYRAIEARFGLWRATVTTRPPLQESGSTRHRACAQRYEYGWEAVCECGWRTTWRSPVAARREAKTHRRYPDGNPRLKAMEKRDD